MTALLCFSIFLYLEEPPIILNLTNYRAELKPPFTPPASSIVNLKKLALLPRTAPKLPVEPATSKAAPSLPCVNNDQRIIRNPANLDLTGKTGLIVEEDNLSYDIKGTNSQQIYNQLFDCNLALDDMDANGVTSNTLNYSYDFESVDGQVCEIKNVAVGLHLAYLLPRLVDSANAPSDLINKWNGFYAPLREHEDEHGKITKNYAETFYAYLKNLADEKKCVPSQKYIEDAFNKTTKEIDAANSQYDDETDHGRNTGVRFTI
ncbi:hypothetical protein A2738_00550 [Candidatus Nomurabacteria bacterium RIFCSPHIGHO2_01_FULL_42_15]|uniref:DUF922 domain-containing protein n=1 Tax=Candidatus Nomurabacteria bacterium RIFCSPHIGHO2_01_FULL_42_15 TaxID=1801742 RepID=A0A1F6VFJ1_9BACT|nr:MAG: hypothetical protein A2738_00550 [Candidatus Nomurabacteria bacterium RIFCSPHIGHO2_01_FULL_42_15]OGI93212.1 MAG: hypothetical protein A3A99_01620 [Candidatus Nomurabacteria bacterium RIFCSPLOWO2_01_FULL_41_18]